MRMLIIFGAIAGVALSAGPSLSKNSEVQKPDENLSSSGCDGYAQQPDGSWKQMPCRELGPPAPANQKTTTRGTGTSH
jgi:hypothetical protein